MHAGAAITAILTIIQTLRSGDLVDNKLEWQAQYVAMLQEVEPALLSSIHLLSVGHAVCGAF
jgi:hypothetical protein